MSLILAPTASQILRTSPIGDSILEAFFISGVLPQNNQVITTTATFTVAAVNASQSVAISNFSKVSVGETIQIGDGTHTINGTVTSVVAGSSGTGTIAVTTNTIVAGAAGNTMGSAATITPITNGTFVAAAVGATQVVPFGTAAEAALFVVGDAVTVTDGTTSITGTVTLQSGKNLTLQTTVINSGSAGNTVATAALATSTSGDKIALCTLPPGVTLLDEQIISSAANTSMTVSSGFFSIDNTETTHGADLIAAGTALATATRIRANAAVSPPTTDLNSYLTVTIGGAVMSFATRLDVILASRYKGLP
jgi:hypothetical protein